MNKNTILAFILILITVAFFSSPTWFKIYYEKILHQPYPVHIVKKEEKTKEREEKKKQVEILTKEEKEPSKRVADTIWIENKNMIVGICQIGARITSIKMKSYKYTENFKNRKKDDLIDLIPENSEGGAQLQIGGNSYDDKYFDFYGEKKIKINEHDNEIIDFIYKKQDGDTIRKEFYFEDSSYKIGLNISENSLPGENLTVSWKSGIEESEITDQTDQRLAHYYNGESVQNISLKKQDKEETSGFYRWIGLTSKYFFISMVADTIFDADLLIKSFEEKATGKTKQKNINYSISYSKNAENQKEKFWFYTGPTQLNELQKYHLRFEKILFPVIGWPKIFFWADKWFPWLAEFVLWLLLILYKFVKDYGIAIIIMTILSRIVTYPMTQSSMKSMNRMKDVQPKINAIRNKYKNNPKKMNEEIMSLYKEEGINPLNPGCLPLFLQMPIFIALFVVLRKAIELRGTGTVLVPWIHDLSKAETLISLKSIIPNGIPMYGSSIALLPIIMAILTYFQNKMTIKDPNQKMMIYFMPIFMLVLFNNFPSGLVLYWTFSNALAIVQQYYTNKSTAKIEVTQKNPRKKNKK